ncbi:hypothetical protein [Methylobacterium sp. J-070]|uniref:hypothetical protein n=1 Tax=Methylobacterium sp. J-070 TaxID=2836650 RepID=UPI001FBACE57|nr:hypothetical protein [Methylobacterium sp. J-070]MCJ2048802.1 hypothetical protein [Methylobacterium sp. J-070]
MPENEIPTDTVTCLACGWVSYAISRSQAEANVERFNRFRAEDPSRLRYWPNPKAIGSYRCMGCSGWGPYRPAREGDCPRGATINPVLLDED